MWWSCKKKEVEHEHCFKCGAIMDKDILWYQRHTCSITGKKVCPSCSLVISKPFRINVTLTEPYASEMTNIIHEKVELWRKNYEEQLLKEKENKINSLEASHVSSDA